MVVYSNRSRKEAIVLWTLIKNPGISLKDLARIAKVSRTSLYRMETVRIVLRCWRSHGRQDMPKGYKQTLQDESSRLEAYYKTRKDDEES